MVVPAAVVGAWPARLQREELGAPTLLWSEVAATVRRLEWRGEIDRATAIAAVTWIGEVAVSPTPSAELLADALSLAARLGWARTYDAEYVVLARRLGVPLVTLDARLARSVASVVEILAP